MLASLAAFLISNVPSVGGRVYPPPLRQEPVLPAITYTRVSFTPRYGYEGDLGLNSERVQLDIWGESKASVEEVAEEVVAALSGFRGPMWDVQAQGVFINNLLDRYEPKPERRRVLIDVTITYTGG